MDANGWIIVKEIEDRFGFMGAQVVGHDVSGPLHLQ
jgi:hypothetical protein